MAGFWQQLAAERFSDFVETEPEAPLLRRLSEI
jgi:hypothetical protein